MKKLKIAFILLVIILEVAGILAGLQSIVSRHEQVHQKIFEEFGVKSKIELGFLSGATEPLYDGYENPESLRVIRTLTSVNEIVTYQFYVFYLITAPMIAGISILILAMWLK
jgi:hypothetical protein